LHDHYTALVGRLISIEEKGMPPAQHSDSLMLLILVIVTAAVIFWRATIKLVVIGVTVLIIMGLLEALRGLR
jgi:hypothetical protein